MQQKTQIGQIVWPAVWINPAEISGAVNHRVTRGPRFPGTVPGFGDLSPAGAVPGNVPGFHCD